jgi:hypothetical protein
MEEDEMKLQILQSANRIVEDSRMYNVHASGPSFEANRLWHVEIETTMAQLMYNDDGATDVHWYQCPMLIRERKLHYSSGEHDENSDAHDKDKSQHLAI